MEPLRIAGGCTGQRNKLWQTARRKHELSTFQTFVDTCVHPRYTDCCVFVTFLTQIWPATRRFFPPLAFPRDTQKCISGKAAQVLYKCCTENINETLARRPEAFNPRHLYHERLALGGEPCQPGGTLLIVSLFSPQDALLRLAAVVNVRSLRDALRDSVQELLPSTVHTHTHTHIHTVAHVYK